MSNKTLPHTTAVILLAVSNEYRYGFDIMDQTGLPSGTVYPALRRLEEQDFVTSKWESETDAQREGRPARKYYEITDEGSEALTEAVKRYKHMERLMPQPTKAKSRLSPKRGES
jgi:PadR family transcriptional regulator, regulatory protein PadR